MLWRTVCATDARLGTSGHHMVPMEWTQTSESIREQQLRSNDPCFGRVKVPKKDPYGSCPVGIRWTCLFHSKLLLYMYIYNIIIWYITYFTDIYWQRSPILNPFKMQSCRGPLYELLQPFFPFFQTHITSRVCSTLRLLMWVSSTTDNFDNTSHVPNFWRDCDCTLQSTAVPRCF